MKETKYSSYLTGKLVKGCELCVEGRKMVLFVTGLCSRGCDFCPLSKLRMSMDKTYANERPVNSIKDVLDEVKASGAKGCSITGGDPLLKLKRTVRLGKALKKKFGKNFHIHIYLSTKLVNLQNLKELSEFVDEVRFHPDFEKPVYEEIEKIKLAGKFWKSENIGIEIPLFPDKTDKIYNFIVKAKGYFSFLNFNELEAGEVTGPVMAKKYELDKDGYLVKSSIDAGKKLIKKLEKSKIKININLCTSKLKLVHQYGNRLKNYKPFLFSKMTDEGTLVYFSSSPSPENRKLLSKNKKKNKNNFVYDKEKNQLIINPGVIPSISKNNKNRIKIYRTEEYPTFDREEVLREELLLL
ncbi:MAG: radical SAM protein [archaeon]|nr:radical SAM protein [archaeon]